MERPGKGYSIPRVSNIRQFCSSKVHCIHCCFVLGGRGVCDHQELPSRGCLLKGPLHLEELATSAFSPATECEASKAFAVLKDQSHSARYALEALLGT